MAAPSGKDLPPMARSPLRCILTILLLAVAAVSARGLVNPHIEPAPCPSCHMKVPSAEEVRAGDYFLLKDTIDDTCEVCHPYTCCEVGSLHEKEHNHPSNINRWDSGLFRRPKTLPLFDGYITCATCHLHRKPEGKSYKLVRIVKITSTMHDWAGLCRDCHTNY